MCIRDRFSTDQSHFVEQKDDGSYKKKAGVVNPELIKKIIVNNDSIAIYQKNLDLTVKWICFDFDILKEHLDNKDGANPFLERAVLGFCKSLNELDIPYLLEFSGNRGFHVWIMFSEPLNYHTSYDIQQAIISKAGLDYNDHYIGLDLFPHSATPTDGVGLGVKMPLSKHKKSGFYAFILPDIESVSSVEKVDTLTKEFLIENNSLLESVEFISKSDLEKKLDVFFNDYEVGLVDYNRIKSIKVHRTPFSVLDVLNHWDITSPLKKLSEKIRNKSGLSHLERILIVGIFCNIKSKGSSSLSDDILHGIFKEIANYNATITSRGIQSLRGFNFPTQDQIENTLQEKFGLELGVDELIRLCVPNYLEYCDASFDFSVKDIDVTRVAETNYLFMNDEVQSKIVLEDLSAKDSEEFLLNANEFTAGVNDWGYYRHERNEGDKTRVLISLDSNSRIASSCILKQMSYYFDLNVDVNSHGYQINKGFSGGYIFKPWLYLWLKFISNITEALEEPSYKEYYIVKTDISGFYDNIPHDNLKRLLLGDGNSSIKEKINNMRPETNEKYKECLEFLFKLTEDLVGGKKGLPQGPAYARYFAELYLTGIDGDFKKQLLSGDVLLYQRYVDDIFFVVKTKEEAVKILSNLKLKLKLLNLMVNDEKTDVSKIGGFYEGFNKYRAQSKYSVDQVSKRFLVSSDKQKNMAINEFMTLIHSDTCQDDLSFIFSHLGGVNELNSVKTEQVKPALDRGVGRGSLYKNLFNFVFELNEGWEVIYSVEKYTELQSEVLSSSLINSLEINRDSTVDLLDVVRRIFPLLTYSDLVYEHMAYIYIRYDCDVDIKVIPQKYYVSALRSISNCQDVFISSELIDYLNLSMNQLKSFSEFIKVVYIFCYNDCVNESKLDDLASLFYAKVSLGESAGLFELDNFDQTGVSDLITAHKLYYLLCLFSTSCKNESIELIQSLWRFCIGLFNKYYHLNDKFLPPNWMDKLKLTRMHDSIPNWIISSIVDGGICRDVVDDNKIFERYHNALLVYLTFDDEAVGKLNISEQLSALKGKSVFYDWLVDNSSVSIFPVKNKYWFERNIINNGVVALKKGDKVLIRKPSAIDGGMKFGSENPECLVDHDNSKLVSFRNTLKARSVSEKLKILVNLVEIYKDDCKFPCFFLPDRGVFEDDLTVFSPEFSYQSVIIYDDEFGKVETFDSTVNNFINCFLMYMSSGDDVSNKLFEYYFSNLNSNINKIKFINDFYIQIDGFDKDIDFYYYDVAMSSALYSNLLGYDLFIRLERFVSQYAMFYDSDIEKQIFGVKVGSFYGDSNLTDLFRTVSTSLKLIVDESVLELSFYLYEDISNYEGIVADIIFNSKLEGQGVGLTDFKKSDVSVNPISKSIKIDGVEIPFDKVSLINSITREVVAFEFRHSGLVSSSEHIFSYGIDDEVYLLATNSFMSVMYSIISNRYNTIIIQNESNVSYPLCLSPESKIDSLNGFDSARDVVSNHRDVDLVKAESIIVKWLSRIPLFFHQPLINLIGAHEMMRTVELDEFVGKVSGLISAKANLFLIKKVDDYNGTHRVLYRDDSLGREVSSFRPILIEDEVEEVTLIVDVIITGSQVSKALKYYLTGLGGRSSDQYFECTREEHESILKKFSTVKVLSICTVLYTEKSISKIQGFLRSVLKSEIEVRVIHGRDVSANAFFGTTDNISVKEKEDLRTILKSSSYMSTLYSHLLCRGDGVFKSDADIDGVNMIARYNSLPKKSFDFLRCGLKTHPDCKPFNKISELNSQ